eukprot:gene13716-biopygen516
MPKCSDNPTDPTSIFTTRKSFPRLRDLHLCVPPGGASQASSKTLRELAGDHPSSAENRKRDPRIPFFAGTRYVSLRLAYVSLRLAYVSLRLATSRYVSLRKQRGPPCCIYGHWAASFPISRRAEAVYAENSFCVGSESVIRIQRSKNFQRRPPQLGGKRGTGLQNPPFCMGP